MGSIQPAALLQHANDSGDADQTGGLRGTDLETLMACCPRLHDLDISHAPSNDLEWWSVCDAYGKTPHTIASWWGGLTSLRVSLCGRHPPVGDAFVNRLAAEGCTALTRLDLSGAFGMTNAACGTISRFMTRITSLNISGDASHFSRVSNSGLLSIASSLKALSDFEFRDATRVTEEGLSHLLNRCPLQRLVTSGCEDVDALHLSRDALDLIVLQISETYTSDRAITSILSKAPRLRSLDLCGCADITDEVMQ